MGPDWGPPTGPPRMVATTARRRTSRQLSSLHKVRRTSGLQGALFAPTVARLPTLIACNDGRLHGQAREGATPLSGAPNRPRGGLVRRPVGVAPSRAVSAWWQALDVHSSLSINLLNSFLIDLPIGFPIDLPGRPRICLAIGLLELAPFAPLNERRRQVSKVGTRR